VTTYPARLAFALDDARWSGAVIQAARDLQLPFEVNGPENQVVVLVDSPKQAYEFGRRTHELLPRKRGRIRR
jgi:hypothetical protein